MKKIASILAACFIFSLAFFNSNALAGIDNFDSYSTGALAGNGYWEQAGSYASLIVADNVSHSGSNSVYIHRDSTTVAIIYNDNNTSASRNLISFYFNMTNAVTGVNSPAAWFAAHYARTGGLGNAYFGLYPTSSSTYDFRIDASSPNLNTNYTAIASGLSLNAWYLGEIEFDFYNNTYRGRVNRGEWSSSKSMTGDVLYIKKIPIYNGNSSESYIDNFMFGSLNSLSFPLDNTTAYIAPVSAVMDQSTLGTGAVYDSGEDGEVETFEGEIGDVGPYTESTCYRKFDNTAFGISFNYEGTSGTGNEYYLCYDAHPGYDYKASQYTDIHAPVDGVLCVATSVTEQPDPAEVWRDTTNCPLDNVIITNWLNYHTFYIIHEGLYINGSINDYMTVFLHNDDLETLTRADIEEFGYAYVTKGQHVAEVGDVGASGAYHIHLEVYKKNVEGSWERVDPYGDGTNNILWE